jgi:hypothetical protein
MATEEKECPFCGKWAKIIQNPDTIQTTFRDCLCDKFIISEKALEDASEYKKILKTNEEKILFSGYLRNHKTIEITSEFISEKLSEILDNCKEITLSEKISKIKSYIYNETSSIGMPLSINIAKLYTIFYLKNSKEFLDILRFLKEEKILSMSGSVTNDITDVTLTVPGFSEIESTLRNHSQSKKVFIACKFKTTYQDKLVKVIKAACTSCGFEANLVSDERHNNNISNKIISDIKQSKFIIADFTNQNNGVYFEAGYAMGMSKEVIRLIDERQKDELHFDISQFSYIPWENGKWEELKEDLIDQIKATIK